MTRCKSVKRISSRINQVSSLWRSCWLRSSGFLSYAAGDRSAATRPMATRMRTGDCREERRISASNASLHGVQRTHSWRGSGAPTASLSTMGRNQIELVQTEQRMGAYQRSRCTVSLPVTTVPSSSDIGISLARCLFRTTRVSAGSRLLFCSRDTSRYSINIVPYAS